MLKDFEKAQLLFEKHEFEAAYSLFYAAAQSDELTHQQRIESYQYAISCKQKTHDLTHIDELKFQLIKLLYNEKQYSQILEYIDFRNSLTEYQLTELYQIKWQTFINLGEIEKSEKAATQCLKSLFLKGDFNNLKHQAEEMRESGLNSRLIKQSDYMLCLLRGDEKKMLELLEADIKGFYSKRKERSILSVKKVIYLMPANLKKKWGSKSALKGLYAWLNLQEEHIGPSLLKRIAVHIFEFLASNSSLFIGKVLITNYAFKARRFDFADVVSKSYQKQKPYPYLNELVSKIESEMVDYSELPEELTEDVDYATDLFRSEKFVNYDSTEKIKKLEKQIVLLYEEGHKEKAVSLTRQLEELDPAHDLVKDLYEKELFEQASRRLQKHKNIDDVRDDLLREIRLYSDKKQEPEEELAKSTLRKTIEYLDDEIFKKSQNDIAIACLELGFPEVAEKVLDDPRGEGAMSTNERQWFIKISCLLEKGESFKALDFINENILNHSLSKDELACFLYMKGEALRLQGRRLDALKEYKKVSEINPRYRLVSFRLKESV